MLASGLLLVNPTWANEKVVLQLKWLHQFQFAGYYAAKEKGYYAEAGFDVTIKERNSSVTPVEAVLNNQADFGIVGSSIILDRMKGLPVVALAAVFQHSPLVLITLADSGIIGPYELKGKRVMYSKGADDATFFAMFHQLGINESDFEHVAPSFDAGSLIRGETDAIASYLTNQPYYYKEKGYDIHIINPINFGVDFYDDILFTSEKSVRDNPERTLKFLEASMKGWRYALENKDEVIGWLDSKYPSEISHNYLQFEAEETEKMILPNMVDIGHMSSERFHRIADIYKQQGLVDEDASYSGVTLGEYLYTQDALPFWAKFVFAVAGGSLLLTIFLVGINRRLKAMVDNRAIELSEAQANLARYVDIVDRYVISSQTDLNGIIIDASTAFCEVSGYSKNELIGQSHSIVKHADTLQSTYQDLWSTIKQGNAWAGELKNQAKDGSFYWLDARIDPIRSKTGDIYGYISIRQNITDKKQVEQLSITDSLTGLNNRMYLDNVLSDEFRRMSRYTLDLSIILCDIDFFKMINDNYGHLIGDQVLISISKILRLYCRDVDVIGRWGGEEFLIICRETNVEGAMIAAEKLRAIISDHVFPRVGHKTASFGVTLAVPDEAVEDALQRADQALYRAKELGRNRVECQLKGIENKPA
ncbi:MAG: diguanylate cyclase (GGDEF)-like protein/PAS domain S-box-containing protein [Colwellia sp.]|jgi:diguanylate cyclase (GGDEF)-like protein/PAS domain S-box-containing protein|tara:strand:+ start:27820 stop:29760 length:1941 start_codon:yes stop_codon:yes gene_type:complete